MKMSFSPRKILLCFGTLCCFADLACAVPSGPGITEIAGQSTAGSVSVNVPVGKTLVVPVRGEGAGPMSFAVSSSNAKIIPVIKTGNPYLKMSVSYAGTSGSDAAPAFAGDMVFQLFRDLTPQTANLIGGFAQSGFYDNIVKTNPHTSGTYNSMTFHRVQQLNASQADSYIIQGGDPDAQNPDASNATYASGLAHGPGYSFDNELAAPLIFDGTGQLAMANSNGTQGFAGTNGSQFFVTQGQERFLDFNHTIFGQLVRGFDVLEAIIHVPVNGSAPTPDVVITNAARVDDGTDCVLLVSALTTTGTAGSPVTITATDVNGLQAAQTFSVVAADDLLNDPPILKKMPDVVAPLKHPAHVPILAQDLEFDFLFFENETTNTTNGFLSNPTGATLSLNKNVVTVTPNKGSPKGRAALGISVEQFGAILSPSSGGRYAYAYDTATLNVGLGDTNLTPLNAALSGTAGVPLASGTVGAFGDANALAGAADFTSKINFGDGSPLVTGSAVTLARVTKPAPAGFAVSAAAHTYAQAGTYPVYITVSDTNGATAKIESTAVISDSNSVLAALGHPLVATRGVLNKRLLATFSDTTGNGATAAYTVSINWGDGSVTTGSIRADRAGFGVYGSHKYKYNVPCTIDVAVTKGAETAHAWSRVDMALLAAPGTPPFAQAHILANNLSTVARNTSLATPNPFITTDIFLVNSGNKAAPVELKFYLSSNTTLDTNVDRPLLIGLQSSLNLKMAPGQTISGPLTNIRVPFNVQIKNSYLIMQVIYSDPVGDHMPGNAPATRYYVSPQITVE